MRRSVSDANLPHSATDARHRFPIVWIESMLHLLDLKTDFPSNLGGKLGNNVTRVPEKSDHLHDVCSPPGRTNTPPVVGALHPVVVGKVSGRPFSERTAR